MPRRSVRAPRQMPAVTAVAPYAEPEVLKTTPIPGGGEIRLEALSPRLGGPPIVRHVADFKVMAGVHTIESYLQVPAQGFTELGPEAEEIIAQDCKRLIELVAARRRKAFSQPY